MRKISFETPQLDELMSLHSAHWRATLQSLENVLVLDADEEPAAEPFSFVLPYRAAQQRYLTHVRGCTLCQDSPVWDIGCETGNRLAHEAADAMGVQEDQATQN